MMSTAGMIKSLIPIIQFNRGQASRIFDRLRNEKQLIVLKNNQTSAVILSPAEYERLSEIEENYYLLIEAQKRLEANEGKPGIPMDEVMKELGITEKDIDASEVPDIG